MPKKKNICNHKIVINKNTSSNEKNEPILCPLCYNMLKIFHGIVIKENLESFNAIDVINALFMYIKYLAIAIDDKNKMGDIYHFILEGEKVCNIPPDTFLQLLINEMIKGKTLRYNNEEEKTEGVYG